MKADKTAVRILIAEGNEGVAALVHSNLVNAGYEVAHAADAAEVLAKSRELSPALIILDTTISGMAGNEVLRTIKATPITCAIPVVVVSEQSEEIDRIVALELGADDYVAKPFSARELALRVRAILSRRSTQQVKPSRLSMGRLKLDADSRTLTVNGKPVDLTALDFRLLTVLMSARGGVVSREKLIDSAWGSESEIASRTVDTQLRRLRKKIGAASGQIQTVRGFGYQLTE